MLSCRKVVIGGAILATLLVGCMPVPPEIHDAKMQSADYSEQLGTKWGDDVTSPVQSVSMSRLSHEPIEKIQVYYADKHYTGRAINSISLLGGKVEFSVVSERGKLPLYRDVAQYYLHGKEGQAYQLVYHNNSDKTYEVVASVDGLNVLSGVKASRYDSGYVLPANGEIVIEGFRKDYNSVASFIFSAPQDSYAANSVTETTIGNTGVIGTVFYELYKPAPVDDDSKFYQRDVFPAPSAFPADTGFAKPPQ